MTQQIKRKNIAIIGAGIAGITLAKKLSADNQVTIFDKSRGIGGRMATRRTEDFHFDHGAQFFTAQTEEFLELCHNAQRAEVVTSWDCRFAEINAAEISLKNQEKQYFIAKPQMNNLCKYLGQGLDIKLAQQISEINFTQQKWSLKNNNDEIFSDYDYLFLAIPSHQAINLIPKNFNYFALVEQIKMQGCFTLMLGFAEDLGLSFDAAIVKESIISWISLNNSKSDRPESCALVVNSSNEWAEKHIERDIEILKAQMIQELNNILPQTKTKILYENIHRWRYANTEARRGMKSLFDANLNLGLCGDWLISGKVESAFLSALDLYNNIN